MTVRRQSGFTLAEILISIALLGIALLGVMGSIAYGTRHARSGEELAEATNIARSLLNYLQEASLLDTVQPTEAWPDAESGLLDEPDIARTLMAAPFGDSELQFSPAQRERYLRNIRMERLSTDPLDHRYNLARATVEVRWSSQQGQRTVKLMGLVSHVRP